MNRGLFFDMVDSNGSLDHLSLTEKRPRELVALSFSGVPLLRGPGLDESSDDQPLMKELQVLVVEGKSRKHVNGTEVLFFPSLFGFSIL